MVPCRFLRAVSPFLSLLVVTVLSIGDAAASPQTFAVDRTDDDASATACTAAANDCSLRGAIIAANANPGSTINLQGVKYTLTIAGADDAAAKGDLDITADVTINGVSAATTIIDGNQLDRIFQTDPAGTGTITVTIQNLTIQNGKTSDGLSEGGGGIRNGASNPTGTNVGGTLHLVDVIVTGNTAASGVKGGGISNDGVMTIADSVISGNTAGNHGGGIVQADEGSLAIMNTTISGNQSTGDGGGL